MKWQCLLSSILLYFNAHLNIFIYKIYLFLYFIFQGPIFQAHQTFQKPIKLQPELYISPHIFYTWDNFVLSPQITMSITMQMDTGMQFYLNVLPFFVHCIVMVLPSSVSVPMHSGTNTYNEWEIVIWLIEADFFQ